MITEIKAMRERAQQELEYHEGPITDPCGLLAQDLLRALAALEVAVAALPCDSGMESRGEQCDYCFAKDELTQLLRGEK